MTTKHTTLLGILLLTFLALFPSSTKAQFDLNISVEPLECNSWLIDIDGTEIPENIAWEIDGVTIEYTNEGYYLEVPPGESTTVCITLPDLLDFPIYCQDLEGCVQECPETLWTTGDGCIGVFEIGSFVEGEQVFWEFGDGTTEQGGHFTTHEYDLPGTYVVTAFYNSPLCEGQSYAAEVYITDCGIDCQVFVEELNIECGTATLQGFSNNPEAQYEWYVDGSYIATSPTLVLDGFDEGSYQYCALYESPDCISVTEFCGEVYIPGCGCEASIGSSLSDQTGVFFLESFNGNYENTEFFWYIDFEPVSEAPQFSHTFDECGEHRICLSIIGPGCEFYICEDLFIEGCTECETELYINSNNCYTEFVIEGLPQNTEVSWRQNDQFEITTSTPFLPLDEFFGGWNTICYEYDSPECGFHSECVEYYANGCTQFCDVYADVVSVECNTATLQAWSEIPDPNFYWYIDNQYAGADPTLFLENLTPGNHTYCVAVESQFCDFGSESCGEFTINECVECDPIFTETSTDCLTSVYVGTESEDTVYLWIVNDQETFTTEVPWLDIQTDYTGWYTVCVQYESQFCENTVQGCYEFYSQGCSQYCEVYAEAFSTECNSAELHAWSESPEPYFHWYVDGLDLGNEPSLFLENLEEGMHYYCVSFDSPLCDYNSEACGEFYVESCFNCSAELFYTSNNCETSVFIENGAQGTQYNWVVDNETYTTLEPFFNFSSEIDGWQNVCVWYESTECFTIVQECIEVYNNGCNNECEAYFSYQQQDDGTFFFIDASYTSEEGMGRYWYIDGQYQSDGLDFIANLSDCESHQICLLIEGELCNSTYCVEVQGSCNECGDAVLDAYLQDGCWGVYTVTNVPQDTDVIWAVNGVEVTNASAITFEYYIEFSGQYEITATFTEPGCDQPTTLSTVFWGEGCSCNGMFAYEGQGNEYDFYAFSENENVEFMWFVNGANVGYGEVFNYVFDDCGSHEVCLCTISENCEEWFCEFIETDECACEPVSLLLSSFVSENGPQGAAVTFTGETTETYFVEFTTDLSTQLIETCLPDGCYEVIIDATTPGNPNNFIVEMSYNNEVTQWYPITTDGSVTSFGFGVNSNCAVEECDLQVSYVMDDYDTYSYQAYNNGELANVSWYIDGLYSVFDDLVQITYAPGAHQLCAVLETPECPLGVEQCFQIFVEEPCDFYMEAMIEDENNGFYQFGAFLNNEFVDAIWYVNGVEQAFGTIYENTFSEGYYEICAFIETDACSGIESCMNIYVPGDCDFQVYPYSNAGYYLFETYTNAQDATISWYIDDVFVESGEFFDYTFQPGEYTVCAALESGDCGVIWECLDIFVPVDCDFEVYEFNDGSYYGFETYTNDIDATISWFIDDVYVENGEFFDYTFQPGEYTVCAALESGNCGVLWECFDIYVPGDCDFEVYPFSNGAYYGFETYTNDPDATISWYINDVFVEIGDYFDYTFEPGEYSVCAALESGNCGVIWECFDISIEDEFECELFIELEGNVDNTYFFYPDAIGNLSELAWYVDGEFVQFGTYLEVELAPGSHTVCVYSEINECQEDLWSCIDVFVPEDTNCTEITLWIDALGDLPADLLLEYQIEGLLEEIEGDMMLFNSCGETGIVLCVPDGCYNFSLALEEWSQIPIWVGVYIDGSLHEDFVIEPETGGVLGAFGVNTDCETSIEERELDLNVYPNPVSDLINIDLSRWENATVQVLGSNGQLILNQKIKSNKTQLDASSWASGVYFLQIISNENGSENHITRKISVQH